MTGVAPLVEARIRAEIAKFEAETDLLRLQRADLVT